MRIGVTGFQPERLQQARDALGLTKTALSALSGCSAASLTRWESGDQQPEPARLSMLANSLNLPEMFFLTPTIDTGLKPHFFRSSVSTTKSARAIASVKMRWMQEISIKLQEWVDLPPVKIQIIKESNPLRISDEEIEQAATDVRNAWGLGIGPIQDIVGYLENAGVICGRVELGHLKMDGLSHWSEADNRPYVLLIADKANGIRNRFDAAHELGHLVLHRNVSTHDQAKHYDLIESQAHRFASAFLMPAESFASEVSFITLDSLLALKARWKVSVAAMVHRCIDLDLIGEAQAIRLWKNRSARGWVKGEPFDDQYPFEMPKLLARSVQVIIGGTNVTKNDLADAIGFSQHHIESLCGLPEGYFSEQTASSSVIHLKSNGSNTTRHPTGGNILPFKR